LARKDLQGLAELLIDAEMKMFDGLRTPSYFCKMCVTDCCLASGSTAFRIFAEHVKNRYDAERIEQFEIHGDEPGLGVVAVSSRAPQKNTEGLVNPRPSSRSVTTFCRNTTGVRRPIENLHLGVDQQLGKTLQIFPRHRHAALEDGADCAILGKKPLSKPRSCRNP